MVAVVVENFGARTARAGITHLPEVVGSISRAFVITDTDDTFARNADFFFPDFIGFIVSFIDGDPQTLFWQGKPVFTGQQFPCVLNSIMFEIIAEAEVAQHFEESMVTCSVTDVFSRCAYRPHARNAARWLRGNNYACRGQGTHP